MGCNKVNMLLDTHIWIRWLLNSDPIPTSLKNKIESANNVYISAISCWEAILLEQKQRIKLPISNEKWLIEATTHSGISVLPITCDISYIANMLPEHHKDPADRFIIATAIKHDLDIISFDSIFPKYKEIKHRLIHK